MKKLFPLLLIVCTACGHTPTPTPAEVPDSLPPTLLPDTAQLAPEPFTLTGDVVADSKRTCRIIAPFDGRVEGLTLEVGDVVHSGQQIATLQGRDAAERNIQHRQAEAEYLMAERDLHLKQSLYQDGLISQRELTESEERYHVAQTTRLQLAAVPTGSITTPQGGTVLAKAATNGQYVQAGDLLIEVADLSHVWVLGDVYESDISHIHTGDTVTVTTLAYPHEPHRGTIDKVYSALDPDSKTMKVRITLPNAERHLLPGMFATITLQP